MNKLNKTLINLVLSTFLATSIAIAASQDDDLAQETHAMPDEHYRALNHKIDDNIEKRTLSFQTVLEDSRENLEAEKLKTSGHTRSIIETTLTTMEQGIGNLKDLSKNMAFLRELRSIEELGISTVRTDEGLRRKNFAISSLRHILRILNEQRSSNYDLRNCDFEEYYGKYDSYKKALTNFCDETLLFRADLIKSIHELLGGEINTVFDQFLASELNPTFLPNDKYPSIYFRILRGYTTGKVEQVPYFGLCYLGDLDKSPAQKLCDDLEYQIKGIWPKTAGDRVRKIAREKDLQEARQLVVKFEAEDRPILEKYYKQALETLQGMGDISAEELQVLAALRQKAGPEKASVETPQAPKKKKPKKKKSKSTTSQAAPELPDDEEQASSSLPGIIPAPASSVSYPELTETDVAEIEKAIADQKAQHARDRAKKTTPPPQRTSPVIPGDAAADANPEEEAGVIHAQRAKLAAEFWEAKAMPWSDYEKFMTSVMGSRMEANGGGGSHVKFKFMHEGSEVGFSAYRPHKFGSDDVGKRQLENARRFLRETLKVTL